MTSRLAGRDSSEGFCWQWITHTFARVAHRFLMSARVGASKSRAEAQSAQAQSSGGFSKQPLRLPRLAHKNDTMGTHGTRGTNYLALQIKQLEGARALLEVSCETQIAQLRLTLSGWRRNLRIVEKGAYRFRRKYSRLEGMPGVHTTRNRSGTT